MALYYNSIYGAITRTAYAVTTQPGRALLQINGLAGLPCPVFNQQALDIAVAAFDELARLPLLPFVYCYKDDARWRIDEAVAAMLGYDIEELPGLRRLWAAEPGVRGSKKGVVEELTSW